MVHLTPAMSPKNCFGRSGTPSVGVVVQSLELDSN